MIMIIFGYIMMIYPMSTYSPFCSDLTQISYSLKQTQESLIEAINSTSSVKFKLKFQFHAHTSTSISNFELRTLTLNITETENSNFKHNFHTSNIEFIFTFLKNSTAKFNFIRSK